MLKVAQPGSSAFHNFKCGEIFCTYPAVFNVTCCLCATKMHLDQFPSHFQMHHLTLEEECINLDELERKRTGKVARESNFIDNMTIKEEDSEDDPIKQEEAHIDEYKGLQPLLKDTEMARYKRDTDIRIEPDINEFNIGEKLEVQILMRKPDTRNSRIGNVQTSALEEVKHQNNETFVGRSCNDMEESKTEIELNNEDEALREDYDNNDNMDKDWLHEDTISATDSDPDVKDSLTEDLPFPCHICKRSYRSKHSLQKHNYCCHNPNNPYKKRKGAKVEHKCDQCNEVFRSAQYLRGHKWKHTGIFCDICGKTFTRNVNLMRHKIRHTGIKEHKCKECGKEFFQANELKSHMICHTGVMPVICEICGKRCRSGGFLTVHMRRHTGERPAKCDVCGKSFFSFHDLNMHAIAHSGERPFKCDICGSTFPRKKALRVHELIHSKDRKYVCKICGKDFAQSGSLNYHMRTHDAALERTRNDTPQQTLDMLDSSSSHA